MRTKVRKSAVTVGVIAALTLVAAMPASSSRETSRHALANITLGIASPVAAFYLPYLAQEKGYFAEHGLNVNLQQVAPGVLTPALASGSIPFAVFASPQVEVDHLTVPNVAWIGAWEASANIGLVEAPGITRLADLKGHTLGITIPGGEAAILTNLELQKAHLKASDVKLVELGTSSAELAAYASGQIDAFICSQPLQSQALSKRTGSRVDGITSAWTGAGLGGNLGYIRSHPAQAVALLAALNEALADWRSSKADAEAAITAASNLTDQGQLDAAYAATKTWFQKQLIVPSQVTLRNVLHTMKQNGYPQANPAKWKTFANSTYLAAALKYPHTKAT
jgi:ABC-type nitrate/sulfonate/bicarbonate transport system substrate-binding protein